MMTHLSEYDYDLPAELIAQQPLRQRSDARLLLVDRATGELGHHHVRDLPKLLSAGDLLVVNDTQVVPARLVGTRLATGGRWEGLFLASAPGGIWRLLSRTRGKLTAGEAVRIVAAEGGEQVDLKLIEKQSDGIWLARPESRLDTYELLQRVGRTPLPCYIRGGMEAPGDVERYQTVYAARPGSAAAPTAGLHFTAELLDRLRSAAIGQARVTLHVGLDTFRPIKTETIEEHQMHSEWGQIEPDAVDAIGKTKQQGGRVVAVGTTSVRVLETAGQTEPLGPWSGETRLYIRPGHGFRIVDALLTNFHLPRSSLLVLVRTFGGDALIRRAYDEAIRERYRFYSYGDAMLIM